MKTVTCKTGARAAALLVLTLLFAVLTLSSCDLIASITGDGCTEHTDTDGDLKCDDCGEELSPEVCTEHTDIDGDLKCDDCGEELSPEVCTEHTDTDGDLKCDDCGEGLSPEVCTEHTDTDGDLKCDDCGEELTPPCSEHHDDNCDGKCDECGDGMKITHTDTDGDGKCDGCDLCLTHKDGDCDGSCDGCDTPVEIRHADADGDGACDKCDTCLTHKDGDCDDKCDNCDEAVSLGHLDEDGNDRCDKCGRHIRHLDLDCDGKCDECEAAVTVVHYDKNADNLCDGCGTAVLPISYTAKKTASVPRGVTLYPTEYIEWSDTTLRGALVTYTITVTNTGENTATVTVKDRVPEGASFISGCDDKIGSELKWTVTVPVGEERSVSYTVSVNRDKSATDGGFLSGGGASVNGTPVDCYDLYIEKTLNEVDRKYIEKAIRILSGSTYTALDFAKHAYTVAFTNAKAITELLSGSPDEILALILSGTDEALSDAIAPGLFGGRGISAAIPSIKGAPNSPLTAGDLVSGDLIIIKTTEGARMYIVCAEEIYDITNTATKVDISAIISGISESEAYAVVRPSVRMTLFTPSDPDESPEAMNEYQEAIVRTAETYLMRGESLQYEDVYFGLISQSGEHRWTHGEKAPEEYTSDEWGYVNCAVFTYDVYLEALGYALPKNMYTTANLSAYSNELGMRVFRFENVTPGEYTEDYMLEIQREFMQTIEVGDIINVRRKTADGTSGHAMLYVGGGRFIHSGGASYSSVNGVGVETYEPTIRVHKVADYIFNPASVGGNPFRTADEYGTTYVTELILVRPLNKFSGEIPENTQARVENMQDIRAEKTSSAPSSVTVNTGDLITFTFTLMNVGDTPRTVEICDRVPLGTLYVSGGDSYLDGALKWTVTVGGHESVSVSYTVRVDEVEDGTLIDGTDATVGGVMHRCAATRVKKTLTASEQSAIKAAIAELKSEGSALTDLELVNEIYERALGIDAIFADTNIDSVMRDGAESVFATSTKTNNKKNLSKLRTDETYYSRMLVDHLYGGMRFDSSAKLYDRTKLLKEHNLIVGDVLIARKSSGANVYIYAGEGELLLLSAGVGDPVNFTQVSERIMYFGRDFAVLRPSFVTE